MTGSSIYAPVDGLPHGAKLRELYERLYAGTERGRIDWEFQGDDGFLWEGKSGSVRVTPSGVVVYEGDGAEHSRFAWPQERPVLSGVGYAGDVPEMPPLPGRRRDGTLYDILLRAHWQEVSDVIDRILGDLQ